MYIAILYFAWADQRDKVYFIFPKVQGCCMEKSTVMKFAIVFVKQRIPKDDNCIFAYQHYTRLLTMNAHVRALSSMATIIYVFKRVQLLVLPYL